MFGKTMQPDGQQFTQVVKPPTSIWARSLLSLAGIGVASIILTYGDRFWSSTANGADVKSVATQIQPQSSQKRAIAGSIALLRLGVKSREAMQQSQLATPKPVVSSQAAKPRPNLRSYVNAATLILSAMTPHRAPAKSNKP